VSSRHRHAVAKAEAPRDTAAERALADRIAAALAALGTSALSGPAASALATGSTDKFLAALNWDALAESMGTLQVDQAGIAIVNSLDTMGKLTKVQALLTFDTVEARAVEYASTRSGLLIRDISEQVRETVRGFITDAVSGEFTTRATAGRIKNVIGLHSRFAQAVDNTFARQFEANMAAGKTQAQATALAQAAADKHAARLLTVRADAIARTEVMTATNTGRFEGWSATIGGGLDSVDSKKEWITGGNPCPDCDPNDGEVVLWDQPFSNGDMMPPNHVCCRCTAVLLPPSVPLQGPQGVQKARRDTTPGESPFGPLTYAQGAQIAASAFALARNEIAPEVHRAYVLSVLRITEQGEAA